MKIKWFCKKWKELSSDEVYSLLELRSEVFVVEQNCVYQDIDLKDKEALHLLGYLKNNLVAYSRCFNENQYFKETSFGRAIIKKEIRNQGLGEELVKRSIDVIKTNFGKKPIKISAQAHLQNFYKKNGFKSKGRNLFRRRNSSHSNVFNLLNL